MSLRALYLTSVTLGAASLLIIAAAGFAICMYRFTLLRAGDDRTAAPAPSTAPGPARPRRTADVITRLEIPGGDATAPDPTDRRGRSGLSHHRITLEGPDGVVETVAVAVLDSDADKSVEWSVGPNEPIRSGDDYPEITLV